MPQTPVGDSVSDPQQTALEGDAQEDAQMLLALLAGVIEQRKKYA